MYGLHQCLGLAQVCPYSLICQWVSRLLTELILQDAYWNIRLWARVGQTGKLLLLTQWLLTFPFMYAAQKPCDQQDLIFNEM
jgi:hypothetical protein